MEKMKRILNFKDVCVKQNDNQIKETTYRKAINKSRLMASHTP